VLDLRVKDNRKAKTSFGIIDAQSVKNTSSARSKGYDAGKKVSGIKRHIIVDTNGLPHAISVTTADVTDRNGAIQAMTKEKTPLRGDDFFSRRRLYRRKICTRCSRSAGHLCKSYRSKT
jgi:Transposase DDE domain